MSKQRCSTPTLNAASSLCSLFLLGSVVVEAVAWLLKVAVALLRRREARLRQVVPAEGAAAQLLSLALGLGSLDGHQVDVARQGNSPSGEAPGQAQFDLNRPGRAQREELATL